MEERRYIRLSPIEEGLMIYYGGLPQQVLNIAAQINFQTEIDETVMLKALRYTMGEVRFCRLRIHKDGKDAYTQYFSDEEPQGIEVVDFSKKSAEAAEKYMVDATRTPFPNKIMDVQLYNVKLLRVPEGKHILYFNVHHIIMDAYTVTYTLSFLLKVYSAMMKGEPVPQYKDTVEQDIEQSWKYFETEKCQKNKDWWREQLKKEPHFTSMNGSAAPEFIKGQNYGRAQKLTQRRKETMTEKIPSEIVEAVNKRAAELNIAPQLFYLLALRTFLARRSGTEDVCIDATAARRSTIVQKNSGLDRSNNVIIRSEISGSTGFEDALKQLNLIQREIYRHADCLITDIEVMLAQMHPIPKDCTYRTVFFTYQPYFDIAGAGVEFTANQVSTGVSGVPLYLNVMPLDSTANLYAYYQYGVGYTDPESLLLFHRFMLKFIPMGIAEPGMTVDELYDACI